MNSIRATSATKQKRITLDVVSKLRANVYQNKISAAVSNFNSPMPSAKKHTRFESIDDNEFMSRESSKSAIKELNEPRVRTRSMK